ncbi:polysaccharide pyruvyl transferase family protein [Candidatus Arcticimaribacter forsetii]|uniref:polysaccharide pyruvyl transferase family protein n=1 Tax=Candidatus Arcticimaribacter forsetii TaxID=2820661 RepID=UPI0020778E04|nr:polysaccharide pyruvyl transferase family protein [Candidatus Arcticimaribacter forsetii]MDB2329285.1 polysaccharide pyruvyl transferase family protein [Flavobacteriaceae bacterium]MDB4674050.1 polysaccharide pyruvyl transferase family protein [Flavobacteriaceae bacterium]
MDKIKLFVGYYGRNNIGDDLMLKVLYDKSSSYVFLQGDNFYNFVELKKQILLSTNPVYKLIQKIYTLFILKYKGCSQVVFGGGTQFSSNSKIFTQLDIFIFILFCRILSIEVIAESVGIGSLSKKNIFIIGALKMISQISVRDLTSSKKLVASNIKHKVVKDLVYKLNLKSKNTEKIYTLITATGTVLKLNNEFTQNYYKFLKTYLKKEDKNIIFCVFQKEEDEYMYEVLKQKYPNLEMLELSSSIQEIEKVFSKTKEVIGMRYHGLILADIFDLPFKGFSYDDKVKDLCSLKNMPFHKA